MRMKWINFFISSLLVMNLTGCSLFGPVKTPPVTPYSLTYLGSTTVKSNPQGPVISVSSVNAVPGFDTADMIYVRKHFEHGTFSKNRWSSPPADMMTPLLVQSLQNTGCFRAVTSPTSGGTADLALNTQLILLQQEFTANSSHIHMVVLATLLGGGGQEVIAQRRFECTIEAPLNTPYGGVIAANRATDEILNQIDRFVCHHAAKSNK